MKQYNLKYKEVQAFAPATVANVGCGFDTMGFAMEGIGDLVTMKVSDKTIDVNQVVMSGAYGHLIPTAVEKNTASVAAKALLNELKLSDVNLEISIQKNLPLGSGMGSSASSSAAAVYALNHLLGNPFTTMELIPFAMEGERVACGAAHADNVAPSLLGGFVLVRSYEPLDIIQVPFNNDLHCVVVHPHTKLNTADSRKILNLEVSIQDAILQSANAAGLMIALMQNNIPLMKRCIHDAIAEPKRSLLIPNFDRIKMNVMEANAINCNISGSGPSIFSLCENEVHASQIGKIMQAGFEEVGLQSDLHISPFNAKGASIVESK